MRRNLYIIAIITLFFSFSIANGNNLLINGGFENELKPWQMMGAGAKHAIDQKEKNSGSSSLRLEATQDQAYLAQRKIPVEGSKLYYISFWAKTDNIPSISNGALFAKVEWWDERQVCGEENVFFTGYVVKGRWTKYTATVRAPGSAISVDLLLRIRGRGALAWFDDAYFGLQNEPELEKAEIFLSPWAFRGSVATEVKYSPEDLWAAGSRIQLFTDIAFSGETKLYVNLGGWLPRSDDYFGFESIAGIYPSFSIKRAYIQSEANFLKGLPTFRATVGDVDVAYNPYIIKLDRFDLWYWDAADKIADPVSYNRNLRGLSFEQVEKKLLMQDAFIVWDNHQDRYVYGGRTRFGKEERNINFIYTNYVDRVNAKEEPNESDATYGIDANFTYGALSFNAFAAKQEKALKGIKGQAANCTVLALDYLMSEQSKIGLKKWELDPLYSPRYRDKTPDLDPHTGERLELNPVARYGGKNGYGVYYGVEIPGLKLQLQNERSTVVESNSFLDDYKGEITAQLGKLNAEYLFELRREDFLTAFELRNRKETTSSVFAASYPLKETTDYLFSLGGSYYKYNFDDLWLGKHEALFISQIKAGVFQGAKVFFGHRILTMPHNVRDRGFVSGVSLKLANSMNLELRYASPNELEPRDANTKKARRYDDFGLPFFEDNIISLNVEMQL